MLSFLSSNYSGVAIAMMVVGLGFGVLFVSRQIGAAPIALTAKLAALALLTVGLFLGGAGAYHLFRVAQARSEFPAPGELVDVGGYKMHILAEGEKVSGEPTIIWIPGRHDPGLVMHHLHKEIKQTRRSILFDRPGAGWSDTGPFPRTVALEARELHALLENAGETGPFILVPWSFSGLLSTTFAALYPDDVAGLVLLDTTDPAGPVFDRTTAIKSMCDTETYHAWLARFGWGWDRLARLPAVQRKQFDALYHPIADVQLAIAATNSQPRFHHTTCSALRDSSINIFNSIQGDGGLGELPIYVIVPEGTEDQARNFAENFFATPLEQENAARFYASGKNRLARLSNQAEIRRAPPETTHSFPFENPDYVIEQVDMMVELTRRPNERAR